MTATNKHHYHAILEEWMVIPHTNGLHAVILQDETKRFPEGSVVSTSTLKPRQYLVEGNIVETQNTRYLLGKRRNVTFDDGAIVVNTRDDQLKSLVDFMEFRGYSLVTSDSSVFFRKASGYSCSFAFAVRWHNRTECARRIVKKVKLQRTHNRIVVQSHKVEFIDQASQQGHCAL